MITSPPSFASVACLGLGPFFRSVTAGLRLFTVVPTANYQFLFIGSAAAGLCCFLLFWSFTVGLWFLFHCQVNGCLRFTLYFRLVTVGLWFLLPSFVMVDLSLDCSILLLASAVVMVLDYLTDPWSLGSFCWREYVGVVRNNSKLPAHSL